jgi:hypothetical protein
VQIEIISPVTRLLNQVTLHNSWMKSCLRARRAYLTLLMEKTNMSVLQKLCWEIYKNLC